MVKLVVALVMALAVGACGVTPHLAPGSQVNFCAGGNG